MNYQSQVIVAPGRGRLVRRDRALLFLPDATDAAQLIHAFVATSDDRLVQTLAEHVLPRIDTASAFVFVQWPASGFTDKTHVIVRGHASLTSDVTSMPALSGSGSTTWVEHQTLSNPEAAKIWSGDEAVADTDLISGTVAAGGFRLFLSTGEDTPETHAPATAADTRELTKTGLPNDVPRQDSPLPEPSTLQEQPIVTPSPVEGSTPLPESRSNDASSANRGLAALESAAGGDSMEESLQLDPAQRNTVHSADPTTEDPEPPVPPTPVSPDPTPDASERPSGPPTFPGDDSLEPGPSTASRSSASPANDEVTLSANDLREANVNGDGIDTAALVSPVTRARLCAQGHSNAPHAISCRECPEPVDPGSGVVTVQQPTLAVAVMPNGDRVALSGDVILGRRPIAASARAQSATLYPLDAPPSVSRTHLKLSVDGWQLFATDCGSRSGTALVPAGEDLPIELDSWMPHEINGGDRLFLGGPTFLTIDEVSGHDNE